MLHPLQVAAKCGPKVFRAYMMPERAIPAAASKVNGLTVFRGKLRKNGVEVQVVEAQRVWRGFLDFLRRLDGTVILMGHYAGR